MTITISDKIYIPVEQINRYITDLAKLFTYDNPEYHERVRMGYATTGCTPYLAHYGMQDIDKVKHLVLPRGGLTKLKEFCATVNIPIRIIDARVAHPEIDVFLAETTSLEDQQLTINQILLNNGGGLIEMAPGGGKTIAMLGLICQIKQPTLILMHEHRLRTQWEQEVITHLKGNFKLGRLDGDKKEEGDIVIGLIQSAYIQYQKDPSYFNQFGCVITDECHRIPSNMYNLVLNNTTAKYRIGVTGTVERKDNKHVLLLDIIGPLLFSIDCQDIKHRITTFNYQMINTDVKMSAPMIKRFIGGRMQLKLNYTELITQLVSNEERNNVILEHIIASLQEGHFPLILSDRVDHCNLINSRLTDLGYKTVLLTGATRKKTKWEEIRKDNSIQAIVAQTKIAEEGLDYPKLSALHIPCPSSNNPKLKQRLARIRRAFPGKLTPIVYDYVDNQVSLKTDKGSLYFPLRRTASQRQKFYIQLQSDYNS